MTKNTFKIAALASVLTMTSGAQASGYPVVDVGNIIAQINNNAQSAAQWVEERTLNNLEMNLEQLLAKMQIAAGQNAAANSVSQRNKKDTELHNLEAMEASTPDADACPTMVMNAAQKSVAQSTTENKEKTSAVRQRNTARFVDTIAEQNNAIQRINKSVLETCGTLQNPKFAGQADEDGLAETTSLCLAPGLITTDEDIYTPEESAAVTQMINLMAGPYPESSSTNLKESADGEIKRVELMRRVIFRNLAFETLQSATSSRKPVAEGVSELLALTQHDRDRFGSEEWLATVGNVLASKKNEVMTSELLRKMTMMNAIQLHMDMRMYKQQMNMQAVHGAILALEVDPLAEN